MELKVVLLVMGLATILTLHINPVLGQDIEPVTLEPTTEPIYSTTTTSIPTSPTTITPPPVRTTSSSEENLPCKSRTVSRYFYYWDFEYCELRKKVTHCQEVCCLFKRNYLRRCKHFNCYTVRY